MRVAVNGPKSVVTPWGREDCRRVHDGAGSS